MTAEPFGAPGIDFHTDTRVQRQPRAAESTPKPAVEEVPHDRTEPVTVVLGEGLADWIAGKLAGQPWFAQPQPSFLALIEHAKTGEWTANDRARTRRLIWLWGPAALARAGAWSILRVWLRNETPRFGDEQPPIRDVLGKAQESGWGPLAWVSLAYLPARICSQIADYATRTGVALLMVWLFANTVGFPEWITVAHWWHVAAEVFSSATNTTATVAGDAVPLLGKVAGTLILVIAAAFVLRGWWQNRNEGDE